LAFAAAAADVVVCLRRAIYQRYERASAASISPLALGVALDKWLVATATVMAALGVTDSAERAGARRDYQLPAPADLLNTLLSLADSSVRKVTQRAFAAPYRAVN